MKLIALSTFFITLMMSSCFHQPDAKKSPMPKRQLVEKIMEETNKRNVKIEDQQIDDYLKRRGWTFHKTASGLRYKILKQGRGLRPEPGDKVWLEYKTSLIRGEVVYDSKKDGLKTFFVDKDDEISALHEFVKTIKVGARAMLVIPSYLAYGVTGDDKEIPPRATLIMELELKRLQR